MSFTFTSKDKELWLESGQNGIEIHNSLVPQGQPHMETDKGKSSFLGDPPVSSILSPLFLTPSSSFPSLNL